MSQPFSFPFLPVINPPANNVIKEIIVVKIPNDDSCVFVNRSITENTKLAIISSKNMPITPYKIAIPWFFDSSILTLSLRSRLHVFCA
jgi:hypothetical protein